MRMEGGGVVGGGGGLVQRDVDVPQGWGVWKGEGGGLRGTWRNCFQIGAPETCGGEQGPDVSPASPPLLFRMDGREKSRGGRSAACIRDVPNASTCDRSHRQTIMMICCSDPVSPRSRLLL